MPYTRDLIPFLQNSHDSLWPFWCLEYATLACDEVIVLRQLHFPCHMTKLLVTYTTPFQIRFPLKTGHPSKSCICIGTYSILQHTIKRAYYHSVNKEFTSSNTERLPWQFSMHLRNGVVQCLWCLRPSLMQFSSVMGTSKYLVLHSI
jgi:hypothetical protein